MLSVHLENGVVEVKKQPVPRVANGFARIRMLAAGICSTDLELQRGYYGFSGTPGHEFVGELADGTRVAGEINLACGHCDWCARGLGRHCPNRTVLGIVKHPGAFREFLTLPIANLHRVPKSIATEHAVFIEPVADLRDLVWAPAQFIWENGGHASGHIPTRYAGTERSEDGGLKLARKTEWLKNAGVHIGLGQRILATDAGEYPLLEIRTIELIGSDPKAV